MTGKELYDKSGLLPKSKWESLMDGTIEKYEWAAYLLTVSPEIIKGMSDNWISVDDEMPEARTPVLFQVDTEVLLGQYSDTAEEWQINIHSSSYMAFTRFEVKYWQPLPKSRIEE